MVVPLRTDWQALTDVGKVRQVNEDRFAVREPVGLWAVADGMGGLARGDWAAAAVTGALEALGDGVDDTSDFDALFGAVAAALHAANARVLGEAGRQGAQMGATVAALAIRDRRFGVAWAGDSRVYLLREGVLHRLTRDHSQVQELIDRGLLDAAGAARHPLRNVITRAVGVDAELALDMVSDAVQPDDLFLICSDGLHGVLDDDEIAAALGRHREHATAPMVAQCLERGAPDNVTAITVAASEPTLVVFAPAFAGAAG